MKSLVSLSFFEFMQNIAISSKPFPYPVKITYLYIAGFA